jgi:hypothetical protein
MLPGGCLCGAVRYEATGPVTEPTLCHCSICRRASGAPVVAWFTVPRSRFRVCSGALSHHRSSARAVRGFCGSCGSALTFALDARPDLIDVTIATLDCPESVVPADHIHTSTQIGWLETCDDRPRYAEGHPRQPTDREDGN